MTWFEKLEHRKSAVIFSISLIAMASLAVSALRIAISYDAYWHLQMGKDWIENGLSPWIDHYSFTYQGAEIIGPPVLFQAGLHILVDGLGEFGGFLTYKLGAFLLAMTAMMLWLRQIRAPVIAWCVVLPLLTLLLELRAHARPELISYTFTIVAMMLYQRTRLQISFRSMWPIALLLLIWTNYHSSILAYVIFFGLFIDVAARMIRQRETLRAWFSWGVWGAVLVGIGFINPSMKHVVLRSIAFPSDWKVLIQEYQLPTIYQGLPAIYVLLAVSLVTVVLLVRKQKYGFLAVALVFIYSGFTMARMVTPGGIVLLCLFAYVLSEENTGEWLRNLKPLAAKSVAGLALLAVVIPILNSVYLARAYIAENRQSWKRLPEEMVTHMVESKRQGRVFNSYELGGYLIYMLPRENTVYIDGRTGILYPLEHYMKLLEARNYPDVFSEEVAKYGINLTVLEADAENAALMAGAGFELDFVDTKYALYTREAGAFVNTGKLWARPYCWSEDISASIENEWAQALLMFPQEAPVLPLLLTAREFSASENSAEFLEMAANSPNLTDATRRFLAYRAIETGMYEKALVLFGEILTKETKDYLAASLAHLRQGRPGDSERLLDEAARTIWPRLEFTDILIQHALIHEISRQKPLEAFDAEYIRDLEIQVGDHSLPTRGEIVTVRSFCPGS
jgi:hypothetical protein